MTRTNRHGVAAALAAAAVLAGCSPPLPPATLAEQLLLVVSPQPGTEVSAWSMVTGRGRGTYPVFVTLARGGAELDAWHAFLDGAGAVEDRPETRGDLVEGELDVPGTSAPATTWVGEQGARVAVDAGDGPLEPQVVDAAVDAVLGLRGTVLPDLPLTTVVGAARADDVPDRGRGDAGDGQPRRGVVGDALLAREPQVWTCVVTWPSDPELTQRREVPPDVREVVAGLAGAVVPGEPLVDGARQSFTCRRPA